MKIDRHSWGIVGGRQRHGLVPKVDPKDSALDDQRRLRDGWRLRRRLGREQEQADDGDARYSRPIAHDVILNRAGFPGGSKP